jgi:hypothetical protein
MTGEDLSAFGIAFITAAGTNGIFAFIVQKWVEHKFGTELTTFKHNLELAATERNIKLTKVFERQAEAIAEIYSRFTMLLSALGTYTNPMRNEHTPPLEQSRDGVGIALQSFIDYYKPHAIYLPKKLQRKIETFVKRIHGETLNFMFNVEERGTVTPERMAQWGKSMDFMTKDVPKILDELDSELKKLLGVEDEEPEPAQTEKAETEKAVTMEEQETNK